MAKAPTAVNRVLIVENEPDFAALLASILARAGYVVATAYNCDDALWLAGKLRPSLITLDISMPRKSGASFYLKLKAQGRFRYTPVIVVTGITSDKQMEWMVRRLLEQDGVPPPVAYVEKPIDENQLLRTIEDALSSVTPN